MAKHDTMETNAEVESFSLELLSETLSDLKKGVTNGPRLAIILEDFYKRLGIDSSKIKVGEETEGSISELSEDLKETFTDELTSEDRLLIRDDLKKAGEDSYYLKLFKDPLVYIQTVTEKKMSEDALPMIKVTSITILMEKFLPNESGEIVEGSNGYLVYKDSNGMEVDFKLKYKSSYSSTFVLILKKEGTIDTEEVSIDYFDLPKLVDLIRVLPLTCDLLDVDHWYEKYEETIPADPQEAFIVKSGNIVFDAKEESLFYTYDRKFTEGYRNSTLSESYDLDDYVLYLNQRYYQNYLKNTA